MSWRVRLSVDWPLFGILATASLLRLHGLSASSLWTDEARVAMHSLRPLSAILTQWPGGMEPPASYLLTHLVLLLSASEIALRLPYVIASLIAVWLVYRLGAFIFSRRVGLLAAVLLAISPLDIRYAQEVRYYALFSALFLFSTLAFCRVLLTRRGWIGYIVWTALAGYTHIFASAILAMHATTALLVILARCLFNRDFPSPQPSPQGGEGESVPLSLSGRGVRGEGGTDTNRALWPRLLLAWCLIAVFFLALYGPSLWQKAQTVTVASAAHVSPIKAGAGDSSLGFGLSTIFWDVYYRTFKWFAVPTPLVDTRHMTLVGIPPASQLPLRVSGALVLIGLVGSWRKHGERAWLIAWQVFFALTALALVTERLGPSIGIFQFAVRRMLFLLPLYWLLVALGLAVAGEWVEKCLRLLPSSVGKHRISPHAGPRPSGERERTLLYLLRRGERGKRGVLSWLLALLCCGTVALSVLPGYYRWRKDDWRGAAAYLRQNVRAGEAILCCTSWQTDPQFEWMPLNFYLREEPLRGNLVYVKGAETIEVQNDVIWYISYADEPQASIAGYEATQHVRLGPYWIWVSRWERSERKP